MSDKVTLSIIIPTHNRERQLEKCLFSIAKNTLLPQEIIIVDSSDTWQKIKALVLSFKDKLPKTKLIWRKVKHRNAAYSRNQGVKLAKSKILIFLDDDVILDKNWLKNVLETFQKYKKAVAVGGKILNLYPQNYWATICHLYATSHEEKQKTISFHQYLPSTALAIRKKIFRKFSWNENLISAEDIDLTWKLYKNEFQLILNKKIITHHAFRTNLFSFVKEQFWLGRGFYQFAQNNPDNPHAKTYPVVGRSKLLKFLFFAPLWLKRNPLWMLKTNKKIGLLPGFLAREVSWTAGILYQLLSRSF